MISVAFSDMTSVKNRPIIGNRIIKDIPNKMNFDFLFILTKIIIERIPNTNDRG